jgi:L-glyceraldehyde 3-phosphate reductase
MTYIAADDRYSKLPYRRCGRSGVLLPEVSLGLWQNFGDGKPAEVQRAILRRAFDLGVTHFDLANNYGPPYGSAEINFGRIMREDLRPYRDELIISTKAGYDMWPGPYGDHGSRKYLLASLDQSLKRMGLEYVDIFYSHRFDPDTPLEETMGALDTAVRSGKALYAGISSYSAERTTEAVSLLRSMGTRLLIHQPSYSMLNRWIEGGLLDVLEREGVGCIAFSPLAQGVLTGKYLNGVPAGSRASLNESLSADQITPATLAHVRALNEIARSRGQSLAQLALSWALRDPRVTSVLIGASSVAQLEENLGAAGHTDFTQEELAAIDRDAVDAGINIWAASSAHLGASRESRLTWALASVLTWTYPSSGTSRHDHRSETSGFRGSYCGALLGARPRRDPPYPGLAGGPWLRKTLVPSGLRAVVVPSGCRVTVQPHW